MELIRPSVETLPSYEDALRRGWSPDNLRLELAAREELAAIAANPDAFVASLDDPEGTGPPITLPDGTKTPRLPGYRRWMWDGEFVGSIGFRWQPGTAELPVHVPGHIGYGVVPWKRRRGYATRALALILDDARARGLAYVDLTTDEDNLPSQKTIAANGGGVVGGFDLPGAHGAAKKLRYRIAL